MSNKKNILIITPIYPPDIGGPANYVNELAQRLTSQNNVVKIITFAQKSVKWQKNNNILVCKISIQQNVLLRQLRLFITIIKQLKWTDFIYVQGTLTIGLATLLACKLQNKSYNLKYVGDEVWESYQVNQSLVDDIDKQSKLDLEQFLKQLSCHNLSFIQQSKYYLNKLILNSASQVIVPGKYLQYILNKYYQVKALNIPNAVDIPQSNLSKIKYSIVYVGRLVPWKNIDQIIQAFAMLNNKSKQNWQLTIIGSGNQLSILKSQVRQLKLQKAVIFTGKLSKAEVLKYIAKSEYLVLYSDYEGLSHTLIEAMLSKTKVIASDIKANRDVLQKGDLGKLIELDNPNALAEAFLDKYSQQMLNKAFQVARDTYTWDNHFDKLLSLI